MKKTSEYAKNTIILLLGKFVTQFMSILLLPIYTYYLSTSDYGLVDIIQTYISLLIPVLTLRFDSAVFRFLIDERENEKGKTVVITNVIISLLVQIIIFVIIYLVLGIFVDISYFLLIMFNIIAIMLSNILLQLIRGIGKNKEYAIACIITGITTLIVTLILIIGLKCGAESILIASILANFICSIYIVIKVNIFKYIQLTEVSKNKIKEIAKYSIPMIPNSLSWWIVNVSDRTIITYFLGTAINGIYTVSCKFSNALNSIFSIFNMSWQETASMHINDDDKEVFFSHMINRIFQLFISISIIIIACLPIVFDIIIGKEYRSAYQYIPILLFANIFNVLINLIGGIYVAKKLTKKISNTTIVAAIINICINLIFIKRFGLYAASISTVIAYVATSIYRYYDVKKFINIKLDKKKIIMSMMLFVIASFMYYINNKYLNILNIIICLLYLIFMNKDIIFMIINRMRKMIDRGIKYD